MRTLSGRVAAITGAASGIGLGMARRFAHEGMKVVLSDVDVSGLERAEAELKASGYEALAVSCDVSKLCDVQSLADRAMQAFGAVHLLCNNAGVGGPQRFENISTASWDWQLGVLLMGPIYGCRVFLPILKAQDEAHIVNTASMSGFLYSPYLAPYSIGKAGVVALTESLFRELASDSPHVGVSVLCPAFTATQIADDQRNAPPGVESRLSTDPDLGDQTVRLRQDLVAGQSIDQVADHVVRGVQSRSLHIFPDPAWLKAVESRFAAVIAGAPIDTKFSGRLDTTDAVAPK